MVYLPVGLLLHAQRALATATTHGSSVVDEQLQHLSLQVTILCISPVRASSIQHMIYQLHSMQGQILQDCDIV